jgi:class 3 adenylate cyclase
MPDLPSGTVTLLFTDIEDSTGILERLGEGYPAVLAAHRDLLRDAFAAYHGVEVDTQGDALFAAFPRAAGALAAAVAAQRALCAHPWPAGILPRVRMGLHTGEPIATAEGYVGLDVHRAARICAAGHGGQVLLSGATAELVRHARPAGVDLWDMGERRLRSLPRPEHLFQAVIPGLPHRFPPPRTLDRPPINLPADRPPLIGRDAELAEVVSLLDGASSRLLSLTGPGGVGKTSLALAAAARVRDQYAHGVFMLPLAAMFDVRLLAPAIAGTLGVREWGPEALLDRLMDFLRARNTLLVLDGIDAVSVAPVVQALLDACPRLVVVLTARISPRLPGERELAVAPLPTVDNGDPLSSAAGRLFVERALVARPDFELTREHAAAVTTICARLDGVPLAIELAAARIRHLPPRAVLGRLERRLSLLSSGTLAGGGRRRPLAGALDAS